MTAPPKRKRPACKRQGADFFDKGHRPQEYGNLLNLARLGGEEISLCIALGRLGLRDGNPHHFAILATRADSEFEQAAFEVFLSVDAAFNAAEWLKCSIYLGWRGSAGSFGL